MSAITVQELRPFPGKPRRFSIEKILVTGCPSNKNAGLFKLHVGQIVHLDELSGFRVSGVNILMKRGGKR